VFGDQTLSEPNAAVIELDAVFHPTVSFAVLEAAFTRGVN
jgi:hypothetical protein